MVLRNFSLVVCSGVLVVAAAIVSAASVAAGPSFAHLSGPASAPASEIVHVHHVAPYTCGVSSSKFARICRPAAQTSCKGAVTRGVKGFSNQICAARHTACVSCLAMLKRCINKIGHGPRNEFSCDECTGKFSRCIGKRYPQIKN